MPKFLSNITTDSNVDGVDVSALNTTVASKADQSSLPTFILDGVKEGTLTSVTIDTVARTMALGYDRGEVVILITIL